MSLAQIPPREQWLAEIESLVEDQVASRLAEMQVLVRSTGRCGSLQTSDGLPCRRWPKLGYTVCRKHGERAPNTVKKAERALAVARMPAIEWIRDALDQATEETCNECGFPRHGLKERKRIDMLAFKLLDRTGLGPKATLDINPRSETVFDVSVLTVEEAFELDQLLEVMEAFKTRVVARLGRDEAQKMLLANQPVGLLTSPLSSPDSTE